MWVAEISAVASSSFAVVLDASVLDSGTGACEIAQQELPRDITVGAVRSPISILSHSDCVCGVTHSAIVDEKIAQADKGTGPNPAILSAKTKMSHRRIAFLL